MIYIENVSKEFSGKSILKKLSFTVQRGEIIGLAGPSGSGKSTLLRCIQGIENISSGNIRCTGSTGFLFQDFQLFPHMNVLQNIIYTPHKIQKIPLLEAKAKATELLQKLELVDKVNSYPKDLSGGQKQRVALARMLILSPDTILCDEPTSGLDRKTTQSVSTLLAKLASKEKNMIIASHDLDFLRTICTRIILLKNGSLVLDSQQLETKNLAALEIEKYY